MDPLYPRHCERNLIVTDCVREGKQVIPSFAPSAFPPKSLLCLRYLQTEKLLETEQLASFRRVIKRKLQNAFRVQLY